MIIQIRNGAGEVMVTMRDFFSVTIGEELNNTGSAIITAPADDMIRSTHIRRGLRVDIYYYVDIHTQPLLFSGYINEYRIQRDTIEIQAYNRISYLQHRIYRSGSRYRDTTIAGVVEQFYEKLDSAYALPFSVGINTCQVPVDNLLIEMGTTAYDALNTLYEMNNGLQYRIRGDQSGLYLDIGEDIGTILPGLWEYNEYASHTSNIRGRKWTETLSDHWNYMLSRRDTQTGEAIDMDDVNEVGLVFERYEHDKNFNPRVSTHRPIVPTIEVTQEVDRWNIQVGDKRPVRLITSYDQVQLDYIALIQSKSISVFQGQLKVEIKISEKYTKQTNIVDTILTNMKKDINSLKLV